MGTQNVEAAINILSSLATVCFALLLAPQIVLNQKRRSTDGLSLLLVLLWHAAALLYLPFLIQHQAPFPLLVQWVVFSVASVVLEVQFLAFRQPPTKSPPPPAHLTDDNGGAAAAAEAPPGPSPTAAAANGDDSSSPQPAAPQRAASPLALLGLAATSTAISALVVIGLLYLFRAAPQWLANTVGSALCSLLLAAGFLPQLRLMCQLKSSEGFSLGLSALDLTGSALSIAALALAPVATPGAKVDVGGIVPYAVIVGFQVLVVFLALFVYPDPGRFSHCARWSEWSMEAIFKQHGPEQEGVGVKDAVADAVVVEEGKGVEGNGEERA